MIVLGLTGGICAGKSTATRILSEYNIPIIDADKYGHQAYKVGSDSYHELIKLFGEGIIDRNNNDEINRRALGAIVFQDNDAMKRLTDIVWPVIRSLIEQELTTLRNNDTKIVAIEAAVMIEAKWYDMVDILWVLVTPPAIAVQRMMKRNNFTAEEALLRINKQLTNEERIKHANTVLVNDSDDVVSFEQQIHQAIQNLLSQQEAK